ncbi:MAG: hypothetical protein DMG61_20370 [Acidobacteria bacterium]|nr:MAG: hypothetical protein DMG61_20370 [Acidobacteriota bacterium]
MHFATMIPNWNSLESVRHAHSDLEAAALVFFALLVFFDVLAHFSEDKNRERLLEKVGLCFFAIAVFAEIAAYPYGQRNDTLSEQIIGSLDTKAKDAFTNASNASTKAGDAANTADRANRAADHAETASGNAVGKSSTALREVSDLNRELVNEQSQLEAVEKKRTELETSLISMEICSAPRVLPNWSLGNKETSADPLKPFAGQQAILGYVNEAEAKRAASNIFGTLKNAGWNVSVLPPTDAIKDGVEIQPFVAPLGQPMTQEWESFRQGALHSEAVADALVDFLQSYNWQAKRGWPTDERGQLIRDPKVLPPGAMRIMVGLYPAVMLVVPPGAKDIAAALAQFKEQSEQQRQKMEKENDEKLSKQLTPEQIEQHRAFREQMKKEEELWQKRYSGPCQPLTPMGPYFP